MIDLSIVRRLRNNARVAARAAAKPVPILPGTYTPTYTGGTTAGTTTYTLQDGTWVRIGPIYIVTGQVQWTAATGTGDARVSLPFTPGHRGAASLRIDGVTFANNTPQILITGVNYFIMPSPLTNAGSANVQMEAAGTIGFTVVMWA